MKYPRIWIAAHKGPLYTVLNHDAPPEALRVVLRMVPELSEDEADEIVMELVHNPNAPADVLRELAHHPGHNVRWAVARHDNTPDEVLVKLAGEEETLVRRDAQRNLEGRRK